MFGRNIGISGVPGVPGVTKGQLYLINQSSANNKRLITFLHTNLRKLISNGLRLSYTIATSSDEKALKGRGIGKFPTLTIGNGVPTLVGVAAIERYLKMKFLGELQGGGGGGGVASGWNGDSSFRLGGGSSGPPQSAEDEVEAFQRDMLGPITKNAQGHLQVQQDQEDSEEDNFAKTLQHRLQQELDSRKKRNPAFSGTNKEASSAMSNRKSGATTSQRKMPLHQDNIVPSLATAGSAKAALDRMSSSRSGDMDNDMLARFLDNQEVTPM